MEEWLVTATHYAIIAIDLCALFVIVIGTIECLIYGLYALLSSIDGHKRRDIWLRYARWLVAGLTFQLAADIIETAITTSWDAVGRIAAVAVIRTFLNYFLEHDLSEVRERQYSPTMPVKSEPRPMEKAS